MIHKNRLLIKFNEEILSELRREKNSQLIQSTHLESSKLGINPKYGRYKSIELLSKLETQKEGLDIYIHKYRYELLNIFIQFTKIYFSFDSNFENDKLYFSKHKYFYFVKKNRLSPYFQFLKRPSAYDLAKLNFVINLPKISNKDIYILKETGLKINFSSIKNYEFSNITISNFNNNIYYDEIVETLNFKIFNSSTTLSRSSNLAWSFEFLDKNKKLFNFKDLALNPNIKWSFEMLFLFKKELSEKHKGKFNNTYVYPVNLCFIYNQIYCSEYLIEKYIRIIDFSILARFAILDEKTILKYSNNWDGVLHVMRQKKTGGEWDFWDDEYVLWELLKSNKSVKWTKKINSIYESKNLNKMKTSKKVKRYRDNFQY